MKGMMGGNMTMGSPMTGCDGIVNLNTVQTGPQLQFANSSVECCPLMVNGGSLIH